MRTPLLVAAAVVALAADARPAAARFALHLSSVMAGAGVADFARPPIRDNASPAFAYDTRLVVGTHTPLAFEAAYSGGYALEHDPFGPDPRLLTTRLTGGARVDVARWRFHPFFTAGVGWVNLHSFGRDQAPEAAVNFGHDANGAVFPLGGGLVVRIARHAVLEARGSYDLLVGVKDFTNRNMRPDMWTATLHGGYAF
jgi:hypothetical protein